MEIADTAGSAPFDPSAYEEMRGLVGARQAAALLGRLAEQIDSRLSAEALLTEDPATLGLSAHALVSSAGTFGFLGLARLCGELEAACQAGRVPGDLLARLNASGDEALATIARLRAA
jgi:HPt (histidine-containing phosphotransfer) domain-containing protein